MDDDAYQGNEPPATSPDAPPGTPPRVPEDAPAGTADVTLTPAADAPVPGAGAGGESTTWWTERDPWARDAAGGAPGFPPPPGEPKQERRRRTWPALLAVVLAAGLIGGGLAYGLSARQGSPSASNSPAVALIQSTQAAPVSNAAQMIAHILPSVVNVRVTEIGGSGEGSGVVLSKNGIIVTNAHVVSGATSVKVVFTNGHPSLDATVLGLDVNRDLAVIKVNATDLVPITIGHSSSLKLVDDVYALGFPLDLGGPTVTRGVISGLDRTIDVRRPDGTTEHLVGLLQTDAAINPGNSGGALVDAAGQLVGINTAGAGQAENVGFAIAIDGALPLVQRLSNQKPSDRPWMGVNVESVSNDTLAAQYNVPAGTRGAGIATVIPSSPASSAGLHQGEVIVSIDGTTIRSADDVHNALLKRHPGEVIKVTVVSNSGERTVSLTLGSRPPGLP